MDFVQINEMKVEGITSINSANSIDELNNIRIHYLGKKGILPNIIKKLKDIDPVDRAATGRVVNVFKNDLMEEIQKKKLLLSTVVNKVDSSIDYSLPGHWHRIGHTHPLSQIISRATSIFKGIGFVVAGGPDIESQFNNFEALNTPSHHPSLDNRDTFWLSDGSLLRTQTSPVQIRIMKKHRIPIRIITPGRCYRRDTTDATHSSNFHQIEGLCVDQNLSFADLKGVLTYFLRELMEENIKVRLRPHFFPFTEPSVECDFSCHACKGSGCRVCKQSGWIEIAGAGMVDPRVFEKVGLDPEVQSGFAFGMGIERIAMIKYGISDIRLFYENDVRFLNQF